MFELKYYESVIELIREGSYDICTPLDIDGLYVMAQNVKKGGRCYYGWCKALLLRCHELEKKLIAGYKNYRYMEQLFILAILSEILEALCKWFATMSTPRPLLD